MPRAKRQLAWIPDWRDSSAYSKLTTRGALAWQFLRRNLDYQADWDMFLSVPEFFPGGGKTPKFTSRTFVPDAFMRYYYAEPEALDSETLEEYEARLDGTDYYVTNLEDGLCRKWGVRELYPPSQAEAWLEPYEEKFPVFSGAEDVFVVHGYDHDQPIKCQVTDDGYLFDSFSHPMLQLAAVYPEEPAQAPPLDSIVPVWFSLNGNLNAQIDIALKRLIEMRDALLDGANMVKSYDSAPSVGVLVIALRVFDARVAKVKHAEIQAELDQLGDRNTEGTVRDTARDLKLAKAMAAGDYLKLIGKN